MPQSSVAARRAGADLVRHTAAVSQVPALTNATVTAIVAAVDAGTLNRSLLESAVGRVLAVKGVSLCS